MTTTRRFCHYLVTASTFCIVFIPVARTEPAGASAGKEALAKVAILGYAASIDAFTSYKCRYRCTKAEARSIEDARAGRLINVASYECLLIVDGEKRSYQGFSPETLPDAAQGKPMPGKKGAVLIPWFGSSDRNLADGKREMNYLPQLRAMGLWAKERATHGIPYAPLDMLTGDRERNGPDVLMAQADEYDLTGQGMSEIDGHPLVSVRLRNKMYGYTLGYSFDAGRGYLLVQKEIVFGDKIKTRGFVTDARECGNNRWFPNRCIAVTTPDMGDMFGVLEVQVLELDPDYRASASDFAFRIPAGTEVNYNEDARKRFKLRQDETVSLEDLPTLFDMLERSATTPLMDTAVPHGLPLGWVRWLVGGIGLCVAIVALGYLIRRWRRRAAT